jgi:Protein of unknown function (DUF4231)
MSTDIRQSAPPAGARRYRLLQKEPLVTREMLKAYVAKRVEDKTLEKRHQDYLLSRWVAMVMWWHDRSTRAKWKYRALRLVVIAGGVFIPVLAAASMTQGWEGHASIATAIVGAIVAAAAAWEGVASYGETWREKRRAAELLKVEGWLYLTHCGRYADQVSPDAAFAVFVGEVEKMIAAEIGQYLSLFDASLDQAKKASDDIVSAIVEEVKKRLNAVK